MQYQGPTTTENSNSEGRLKVDVGSSKINILKRIVKKYGLDVYKNSWSCYNGGLGKFNGKPCNTCAACIERIDAFEFNGYKDPAEY